MFQGKLLVPDCQYWILVLIWRTKNKISFYILYSKKIRTDLYPTTTTTTTQSLQSCLTLCDPTDSSPPGSPIPGILQARTLEWVAISFSNAWQWKVKVKSLSHVWLFATPWTAAYQAPPSMGFSRQEYWSGVPLPSPKDKVRISIFSTSISHCIRGSSQWSKRRKRSKRCINTN